MVVKMILCYNVKLNELEVDSTFFNFFLRRSVVAQWLLIIDEICKFAA